MIASARAACASNTPARQRSRLNQRRSIGGTQSEALNRRRSIGGTVDLRQCLREPREHRAIKRLAAEHVVLPARLTTKHPAPGAAGPGGNAQGGARSTRVQTIIRAVQLQLDQCGLVEVDQPLPCCFVSSRSASSRLISTRGGRGRCLGGKPACNGFSAGNVSTRMLKTAHEFSIHSGARGATFPTATAPPGCGPPRPAKAVRQRAVSQYGARQSGRPGFTSRRSRRPPRRRRWWRACAPGTRPCPRRLHLRLPSRHGYGKSRPPPAAPSAPAESRSASDT